MSARIVFLSIFFLVAAGATMMVQADEVDDSKVVDHNQVRAAVLAGKIQPLSKVLEKVRQRTDDPIIGIEFEIEDARWIYEIFLLDENGIVRELYYDAATTKLLKIRKGGTVEIVVETK